MSSTSDIATCSKCHAPDQRECAQCPFNCDLHPHCQDQGCESDPTNCKRVQDRELAILNGTATCAADWIEQQEIVRGMSRKQWTPPGRLAFTRIDDSHDNPLNAPYGAKFIHEGNPGDPYSWVAEIFMRQQHTEKPMSAADFGLRWFGQIISPIYLYVLGMIAAFLIAAAGAANAYSPMVCGANEWGQVICVPVFVNPSAKIIQVEPFQRETPVRVAPVQIESVPLPRPRPKNLGEPQVEADPTIAPIDRPRQVIQQ